MFLRSAYSAVASHSSPPPQPRYTTKRIHFGYEQNLTNSISAVASRPASASLPDILAQVHENAELIKLHASRRAELFFWQMMGLYRISDATGSVIFVGRGPAELQHGTGSAARMTQACHSALLPHIEIYTFINNKQVFLTPHWTKLFLYQSLNATVELPASVNGFDGYLAGNRMMSTCAHSCLMTLNFVANGAINPLVGMKDYYSAMHSFFKADSKDYFEKTCKQTDTAIKHAICDYQKIGTFVGATSDLKLLDEYFALLLGITQQQLAEMQSAPHSLEEQFMRSRTAIWSALR